MTGVGGLWRGPGPHRSPGLRSLLCHHTHTLRLIPFPFEHQGAVNAKTATQAPTLTTEPMAFEVWVHNFQGTTSLLDKLKISSENFRCKTFHFLTTLTF